LFTKGDKSKISNYGLLLF